MKTINRPSASVKTIVTGCLPFHRAKRFADFTKRSDSPRRGFTIIELLVVVAIIGLMTALGFALFSEARAKGRDAKREKDVKTLQDALSIYVTNANTYPTTDASGLFLTGTDAVSTALIAAGSIQAMPTDPQNTGNFRYQYASTDGFTYTLTYYLETNTIPGKSAGQHTASP